MDCDQVCRRLPLLGIRFVGDLQMNAPVDSRQFLVTSHSIDGTFESCARRFEFRHLLGMVPDVDESGFAADAGTALHEAIQQWTRTWNEQDAYMTLMRWWPWRLEDLVEKKTARNFEQATLLLKELMESPFFDEWEPATLADGQPAIELPYRINYTSLGGFKHPVTGNLTFLAEQGKMDWIMRNRKDGRLMVVDLKTTAYDESLHNAAFRFSGQGGSYGMVLSHAVGHDFRKHGLEVCYLMAEFGTYGPSVRPLEYRLEPDEVDDLIRTKQQRLNMMLHHAREAWWPRTTHGCKFWSTPCAYLDVCHRRDYGFLKRWFAAEADRFKFGQRVYAPYWTVEA